MTATAPRFGLNHMVCPTLSIEEFLEVAHQLDANTVEFRNDVGHNSLTDLNSARLAGQRARELGIRVLSVNALYPFNVWNRQRQQQTQELAKLAYACGAEGVVLCPLNDGTMVEPSSAKTTALLQALNGIRDILEPYDLQGFVEPLGFSISSLRFKREALEAIDAINGSDRFQLVHDTFHHTTSGEQEFFPHRTGVVHISGTANKSVAISDMLDGHRVLVSPFDRIGNIPQLKTLLQGGYQGPVSFEPFSEDVWNLDDHAGALQASINYVTEELLQ